MEEALVLCRLLHYGAAMLLFGAGTFAWVLAPPRLAAALSKAVWRLAIAATLILILTALSWLSLEAGSMGQGWPDAFDAGTIGTVLFSTEFGQAWQLHGILVLALLAGSATRRSSFTWATSALVLASLGLVGHAAAHSGASGWFHRANLAVHLLSGGFWLGGLIPLLRTMRLTTDPALRLDAIVALQRFSSIGHGAVAAVVATGIVNAVLILGVGRFDPSSAYQVLLVAKTVLVCLMIALALINRYAMVPRLRDQPAACRAIVRCSMAELALGGAVIALVSLFGLLQPV